MSKRTIAIDFDGVVHSYESGWLGVVPTDPPVDEARDAIAAIRAMGFEVHLFTCRAETHAGRRAIHAWLELHGIQVDKVTAIKPHALLYVDDRAARFNGSWKEIVELAQDVPRPWNGKRQPAAPATFVNSWPVCATCGGHVSEVDPRGYYIECGHPFPEADQVNR